MEREDDQESPDESIEGEKKILVVGHTGCGKTSLIASFVTESPVDFSNMKSKAMRRIINFGRERVQVVLREADDNFQFIRTIEYAEASAVLVCFSFSDIESMKGIPTWIREVRTYGLSVDLSVVGCKLDLKHKMSISPKEWTRIEKAITPYKYLECSAKTGEGVSHLVRVVGNVLVNQTQRENGSEDSVVQY